MVYLSWWLWLVFSIAPVVPAGTQPVTTRVRIYTEEKFFTSFFFSLSPILSLIFSHLTNRLRIYF